MLKKNTLIAIFIIVPALLLFSCGGDNQTQQNVDAAAATTAEPNPTLDSEFIFTAYDVYGTPHSSTEWVGKQPVVLNFWGTWCPPCRKEIPDLVKVYDEMKGRGIEMIGLAVRDLPDNVIQFSMENGMTWVMLMADNSLAIRYRITGVPTTIFISRDGKELGRFVGPQSYETFKKAFELTLSS